MNLLYVVQRYGHEVAGGAELHCRLFATRMATMGHNVEALTSCAVSYSTWENHYQPGSESLDGVLVHRLPVAQPREHRYFGPLNRRVIWESSGPPLYLQHHWMNVQGPFIPELNDWLLSEGSRFDVVVFFTYLYYTTWAGLKAVSGLTKTVLHPTAHDEPPIYLPIFDSTFRLPSGFAFSSHEEKVLVMNRFRLHPRSAIIGIGVDLEVEGDEASFRDSYGLGERPYLLYVGRIDPAKGADELLNYFVTYKERNPSDLALVIAGDPVTVLKDHPDVILTGYVDQHEKHSALLGALALVQPSYFESFSMVLTEAWAYSKPALVQGHCAVLDGQVRRARGGIPYRRFGEFEEAVNLLVEDGALRMSLGRSGRRYVEENYSWPIVMSRYENFLAQVAAEKRTPWNGA